MKILYIDMVDHPTKMEMGMEVVSGVVGAMEMVEVIIQESIW